jgi:hypothetical protein
MMNKKVIFGIVLGVVAIAVIGNFANESSLNPTTDSDEVAWQLLQKTYLDSECKEKYMGQPDAMQDCFDRVAEEQRLNPPLKPELTSTAPLLQLSAKPVSDLDCLGTAQCFIGTVTEIIDGDTVKVDGQSVRFALSSAPEIKGYGGINARNFIETICPVGSMAIVDEDDGQILGSYGRLVGIVTCNDVNLNSELLDSNLGYMELRFCDSSEFGGESWAVKHGCG